MLYYKEIYDFLSSRNLTTNDKYLLFNLLSIFLSNINLDDFDTIANLFKNEKYYSIFKEFKYAILDDFYLVRINIIPMPTNLDNEYCSKADMAYNYFYIYSLNKLGNYLNDDNKIEYPYDSYYDYYNYKKLHDNILDRFRN